MKKLTLLFLVLCFSLVTVGGASAALVVDQEQDRRDLFLNMGYAAPLGQEFIPDVSNLAAAELYIEVQAGGESPVTLNVREDTIDGKIVGTGSIDSADTGWNMIELDSYAWLTVGETYVLEFISNYPNTVGRGYGYIDGAYIFQGTPSTSGADLQFRTYYDDTAAVPVPAAIWLLGSGLLGLASLRKKLNS